MAIEEMRIVWIETIACVFFFEILYIHTHTRTSHENGGSDKSQLCILIL